MKLKLHGRIRKINGEVYGFTIKRALVESGVFKEGQVYEFKVDTDNVIDGDAG